MKAIFVRNSRVPVVLSWFFPVAAITLWPFVFIRKGFDSQRLITHEEIHIKQYNELLVVGFLVLYIYDWIHGLVKYKDPYFAYQRIRFEQEAYAYDRVETYPQTRRKFSWRQFSV